MTARTIKQNFAINVAGAIVPVMLSLITVPVYVRSIGEARYGVVSIVWTLLGYFGFLDLGLSRAAANALAQLRGAPQSQRARVLTTTIALNLGFGLLGSILLASVGRYLLERGLSVPPGLYSEIDQAFPWIVALFPLALLSGVGVGALEARERFGLVNLLVVVGTTIGQVAPVALAVTVSPSLAVIVPAAVLARGLTVCAILFAVWREYRPLSFRFDFARARGLLSYGGWVTVSGVISPILTSLDQFVIGSIMGVAAITHYIVPMNLAGRSQVFAAALSRTLFPHLSKASMGEARLLATRAVTALALGYGSICAPAIVVMPLFFRYWIGGDFAAVASPVADILLFGAWINGIAFIPYGLLQGQGRPDVTGKFHILELLPFLLVLWVCTSLFGVRGAAAAWSLRCAADAMLLFWASEMDLRTVLSILSPPLGLLTTAAVLAAAVPANPLLVLAAAAAEGCAGTVLATWYSPEIRQLVTRFARATVVRV